MNLENNSEKTSTVQDRVQYKKSDSLLYSHGRNNSRKARKQKMNTDQKTEKEGLIFADELSEVELLEKLRDSFDNLVIPDCQ